MTWAKTFFSKLGIGTKLVGLFCVFGLLPLGVVGVIAVTATSSLEESAGARFQRGAEELANKIDRNLFERYGDVQAFGFNQVLLNPTHWYDSSESNPVSRVMDQYVTAYGIYFLTILVDLKGEVIAVNGHDAAGNPIDTQSLYQKSYSEAPWFQALQSGDFTTKMPFTAHGNDVSTGTFIEHLHVDPDVQHAYPNKDALTIGFSAPVYNEDGQVIAYWSNRTDFSLVEQMFQEAYEGLEHMGFPGAELTLLDSEGRILIDYDPMRQGTKDIVHDLEKVIMKFNLAAKGVPVAQKAVSGETGFMYATHARKQIVQAGGYAHLQGALGYPGMNWSVLVRVPRDEAVAEALGIQRKIGIAAMGCLALIIPIGLWVGRKQARNLIVISEVAQQAAEGDLSHRVPVKSQDELGAMCQALNQMFDNVARVVGEVRQGAEQVSNGSTEISQGNEDLSQRTSQQASALEETSASMEEMTSTVKQNADNAKQANQLAIAAREVAERGGSVTDKAVEAMEEINKSSKKIADIINVIDEIAFQTNLLALNAAVEAARAGEQGRGFAVVASEVRNLAQRSATAAKEIKDLINESGQKVSDGSELVNESGKTLEEIVGSVKRVTDIIAEISAASQEQTSGIDQVNKAIMQMDQTTQENAALVEEVTANAQSMRTQASGLLKQVAFFTLSEGSSAPRPSETFDRGQSVKKSPGITSGAKTVSFPSVPIATKKSTNNQVKEESAKTPAGVGSGNGHDRRQREDDMFEEF